MAGAIDETDQQAAIAFLERPQTYRVKGPVERIDTHAAIIFLAGERAFKLKRAVHLPYLDFSTVEKRRSVCEAELALNRRTAPELYLEVRSIGRLPEDSLAWDQGRPIDWVVVMRRFEARSLLENLAEQGSLDASIVRVLADEIARFHDAAAVVAEASGARRVHRVIEGNRASMATLPAEALSKRECERLYTRSLREWERLAALLDRRSAEGHVRHCHGDLHLANICLWRGKPTLFDCLEFNAELATIDVLYDLAFLVMDLWQRGRRSQASLLFNRYMDMRIESDGTSALPLFLSMRAAIRAHVTATAAEQQTAESVRQAKLSAARDYLAAALAFLQPVEPSLVAIGGLSGTGKSTLAGALAPMLGAAPGARWLRTDVMRKRLSGVAPEVRLQPSSYTRERTRETYHQVAKEALRILDANRSVIVDAVFADSEERANIEQVARAAGVEFIGIWLEGSRETLLQRVMERTGDASDADAHVVERQLGYDPGDVEAWHRIKADGAREEVLAQALERLDWERYAPMEV